MKYAFAILAFVFCTESFAETLKRRAFDAIMASPLAPTERIQHFLNRVTNGSNPANGSFGSLSGDGSGVQAVASAWALAEELEANLNEIGRIRSGVEEVAQGMFPMSGLRGQALIDSYRQAGEADPEAGLSKWRRDFRQAMIRRHLVHMTLDPKPLKWLMFEFWFDHFNIDSQKPTIDFGEYVDVLHQNQAGTFHDLLKAVATTSAMMIYLDNTRSVRANGTNGPNENYAREIMELHTLGVGPVAGVYTQADVLQVALILTGWGASGTAGFTRPREFRYAQALHDLSDKTVMGKAYPQAGQEEGFQLLRDLAAHRRTARNITTKLARRFVSEDMTFTAPLRERLFQTYLSTGGDLMALYEGLFTSPEFWSREAFQAKAKRPSEYVTSALKLTGVRPVTLDASDIVAAQHVCERMGQEIYMYGPPTGYPDRVAEWITTTNVVEAVRYGLRVAEHRGPQPNLYRQWERFVESVTGNQKVFFARQGVASFFDLDFYPLRFHVSPGIDPANSEGLFQLSVKTPDRVSGDAQPLRSALGTLVGSKDFLKK